jgi:two-component system chemotaxis sensor kinase CheA
LNGGVAAPAATEEPKQEAPKETAGDGGKDKYKNFVYADFEKHAITEAFEKGMNVYTITVYVDETCLLKAARAFLVFKNLESVGEIIKSNPSAQDIEDEKFEFDFSICIISNESLEKVIGVIQNVSEIKEAVGEKLEKLPEEKAAVANTEEPKADKKEEKPAATNNGSASAKPASGKTSGKPVVNRSVRVDIEKLDVLMNLVSELIIAKNGLVSQSVTSDMNNSQGFNEQIEYLERVTTNLHESVMKVRMQPIETVTQKFPRMIRDLNKKLNKKMELVMTGEDTELDRTVIDEIGDPLMHLLRNSADHGLESAEVRAQRNKPEVGTIRLDAYQDGNNVVIEVGDDGNGIDVEAVKNKAIDKGTITPEQAALMTDKEVIDLLFQPSFSTAKVVSDISGRGVGLDVVKTKIESLGGDIEVKTVLGEGSTFIIRLPLTLAIIQALMVELGDEKYAISLGSIQIIEDIPVSDIEYVQTKEVVNLRGTVIPLIRLNDVLDIEKKPDEESLTVVVVKKGDRLAGLVVDRLIGQQEIVIKSLGKYISNSSKIIGGATILGDGEVALILDVNTLL